MLDLATSSAPYVTVTLAGIPVPKGRPRFRYVPPGRDGRAGFVHVYTPKETEVYEEALKWKAKAALRGRPLLDGPLAIRIFVMLPVPRSWPIKKRDAALVGTICPDGRPDWDNFGKIFCDAMNKTLWLDDGQVVRALVIKEYAENPGIIAEIYKLD
jgi:Holliday junction resolvase RusA-like endonuclease